VWGTWPDSIPVRREHNRSTGGTWAGQLSNSNGKWSVDRGGDVVDAIGPECTSA